MQVNKSLGLLSALAAMSSIAVVDDTPYADLYLLPQRKPRKSPPPERCNEAQKRMFTAPVTLSKKAKAKLRKRKL